jgi:hypothetical protein
MALPPEMDNQILSSSVDANGNPNFLAAGAGLTLNLNGEATPLRLIVAGQYQTLTSNVSITLTATSNQFVYLTQDLANPALVAADFGASALPPNYGYVAPAAPATDQHWFNLSDNRMYRYSGTAWVAVKRIFLGVARTSGAAIDGVVCEPYRLSPQKRFELFGDASDGILEVTGATTVNSYKNYRFVRIDGAALTHSSMYSAAAMAINGLRFQSQNPVLILNGGSINVNQAGLGMPAAGTGVGASADAAGNYVGAGGGGGGAGATNAGGTGGAPKTPVVPGGIAAGGVAGAVKTPGGNGAPALAARFPWPFALHFLGVGGAGANGGGDGTRKGGRGGFGGGSFQGFAPAWLISATSSITANGGDGAKGEDSGLANNGGGGGGGGGGGTVVVAGGYINNLGTISASGGTGGAGGTNDGAAGGNGGNGTALAVRLW